jgi:pre-mRNA-processing factor SLU7
VSDCFSQLLISPTPSIEYINNHTHVWGSFFDINTRQWGYACCHSTIQASYCTGQAGIEAMKASSAGEMLKRAAQRLEAQQESDAQANGDSTVSTKRLGEGDLSLDKDKLAQALSAERKRKAVGEDDDDDRWGGKRRKYGREGTNMDVTEEELGKFLPVILRTTY